MPNEEVKTISQVKAELKAELEQRLAKLESELKQIRTGMAELSGFLKAKPEVPPHIHELPKGGATGGIVK